MVFAHELKNIYGSKIISIAPCEQKHLRVSLKLNFVIYQQPSFHE